MEAQLIDVAAGWLEAVIGIFRCHSDSHNMTCATRWTDTRFVGNDFTGISCRYCPASLLNGRHMLLICVRELGKAFEIAMRCKGAAEDNVAAQAKSTTGTGTKASYY